MTLSPTTKKMKKQIKTISENIDLFIEDKIMRSFIAKCLNDKNGVLTISDNTIIVKNKENGSEFELTFIPSIEEVGSVKASYKDREYSRSFILEFLDKYIIISENIEKYNEVGDTIVKTRCYEPDEKGNKAILIQAHCHIGYKNIRDKYCDIKCFADEKILKLRHKRRKGNSITFTYLKENLTEPIELDTGVLPSFDPEDLDAMDLVFDDNQEFNKYVSEWNNKHSKRNEAKPILLKR